MEEPHRRRCSWVSPMVRTKAQPLERALRPSHQPQPALPLRQAASPIIQKERRENDKLASTTWIGHAHSTDTDLFRILLALFVSILVRFVVLFQGTFPSGSCLGRLGSIVGSGFSRPLWGRLRPSLSRYPTRSTRCIGSVCGRFSHVRKK